MRAKLSTVAVLAVVGGVVVAAVIDSLTGHSASRSPVTHAVPTQSATGPRAAPGVAGRVEAGGTIVFGRQHPARGPARIARRVSRDVAGPAGGGGAGSDPAGPEARGIRVTARERLSLGPGVGGSEWGTDRGYGPESLRPAMDGNLPRPDAAGRVGRRHQSTPRGRLQQPLGYSPDEPPRFYQANGDHRAGASTSCTQNGTTDRRRRVA